MTDRLAGTDEVRETPGVGRPLLERINDQLNALPPETFTVTAQVPVGKAEDGTKELKLAAYVRRENGWSFMGWFDRELKQDGDWGTGFAIRKEFK